ncbi:hypothetical protein BDZ97DRAFT_1910010 [Flammula alnicola]|nr:hypothetical protein BDZ97DRAFT_1910010 [Flammula alnicola]
MPRGKKKSGPQRLRCPFNGCSQTFRSLHGRTYHIRTAHEDPYYTVPAQLADKPPSPASSSEGSDQGLPHEQQDEGHSQGFFADDAEPEVQAHTPRKIFHPYLNALPCDSNGQTLPPNTPPSPRTTASPDDWAPYTDEVQFRLSEFLYRTDEMSASNIDTILELWGLSLMKHDDLAPFDSYQQIYDAIDSTKLGDAPWRCMKTESLDIRDDAPSWKKAEYEIWYRDPDTVIRNMLDNPDFDGEFDTHPYVHLDKDKKRRWSDFMSGNFAWRHCIRSMYVPVILGSDKTTVSVATGDVEYHPLYLSIGNVCNHVRRAHRNAVVPIAFLAIPKSDRKYDNDPAFRKFKRQLYHSSISAVLSSLKPAMSTPVVRRCPDGHFRRVIFDIGPFIADYPEQVMLSGIVQGWCPKCTAFPDDLDKPSGPRRHELTDELLQVFDGGQLWDVYGIDEDIVPFTCDFPRADIHELLSSDILHQVIKGTFKDHLVAWVGEYLALQHSPRDAADILDEIDRRIAATPAFPCLRHFKQGRRFKQWTGDDSKALMKIYLPAIKGLVEPDIVKALSAFLDFCYLVRRADFNEDTLNAVDQALGRYHHYREIFRTTGVRPDGFSLPRQHSLIHYRRNIEDFGAPNGLCSSITESRHITAVKRPWRRSSRYKALGQMLMTNQRLDKLAASRADFIARGMLPADRPPPLRDRLEELIHAHNDLKEVDEDGGPTNEEQVLSHVHLARTRERSYPRSLQSLSEHVNEPNLPNLLLYFLRDQLSEKNPTLDPSTIEITSPIYVFHSAVAHYYAPSDPSGICGMRHERIRSTPAWRGTGPRRDCAFITEDEDQAGFRGMSVVRVQLFMSFVHNGIEYPCALVEWFKKVGRSPDEETGMWVVKPEMVGRGNERLVTVVHLHTFLRGAHLIPVYGRRYLPVGFSHTWSLDAFEAFHVNKYADHHANEIAF